MEFDPERRSPADVPWLRRRESGDGIISAYARTFWQVLAHPRHFAQQVRRRCDVNLLEAENFSRVTLWIAVGSAILGEIVAWIAQPPRAFGRIALSLLSILIVTGPGFYVFFRVATARTAIESSLPIPAREYSRFRRLEHFCDVGLAMMVIFPIAAAIAAAMNVANALRTLYIPCLVLVMASWVIPGVLFHIFGGRIGVRLVLGYLMSQVMLFAFGALASVVLMVPLSLLIWALAGVLGLG
jgi:hypothetical protein